MPQPLLEASREPTQEPAQESVQEITQEPAHEPLQEPVQQSVQKAVVELEQEPEPEQQPEQEQSQQQQQAETGPLNQVVLPVPSVPPSEVSVSHPNDDKAGTPPPPRRRCLPWVAVNHPQDDDDTTQQPETTQPGTVARGKRKAATADAPVDADAPPLPKRTRRPRKAKGKAVVEAVDTADGETGQTVDGDEDTATRRKPRRAPRKKRQTVETEGQDAQPKQKGRPARQSTPSDAEDQIIDPDITFMDGLASHNIRVGKLSSREKQMREIDWAAVKQRRRADDARPIRSKDEQEAADKLLAEAGADLAVQPEVGPRYHLVDGKIQVVPNSGTVNREADAQREIADYEVIEDRDITSHITLRSFLKNNKRFPNDFLLPGQGKRWNRESTERFYQGLRFFGTDFQMISRMFPGSTRRSIKTKFTREEREHSEWVKEALQGPSEIATHWAEFLKAAQLEEESFADADEIKRQMAEDEAHIRERIEAAKEETRQRDLQKAAAGMLDDENDDPQAGVDENGNEKEKQNSSEGKKTKNKGKEKQVTFQDEPGVEIVGSIDDD